MVLVLAIAEILGGLSYSFRTLLTGATSPRRSPRRGAPLMVCLGPRRSHVFHVPRLPLSASLCSRSGRSSWSEWSEWAI